MFELGQQVQVRGTDITGEVIARHGMHEGSPGFMVASKDDINLYAYMIVDDHSEIRTFVHSALVAAA